MKVRQRITTCFAESATGLDLVVGASRLCFPILYLSYLVWCALIASGLSFVDSSLPIAVIAIQWVSGTLLIKKFLSDRAPHVVAISLGGPLGFALTAITRLLLARMFDLPSAPIALVLVLIATSAISQFGPRPCVPERFLGVRFCNGLIAVCAFALYATGQYPAMLMFSAIFASAYLLATIIDFFGRSPTDFLISMGLRIFQITLIPVVTGFVVRSLPTISHRVGESQLLFPLFNGTDDQIYSEQMAWSLAKWGLGDNSAAIGMHQKYHWLTLAWSGVTSIESNSQPWIQTLYVIPLVSLVLIALGLSAIAFCSQNQLAVLVAPSLLLIGNTFPRSLNFFFTNNTSNIAGFIWLSGAILCVFIAAQDHLRYPLVFISCFAGMTALAKGPYVAGLIIGLFAGAIFELLQFNGNLCRSNYFKWLVGASIAVVGTYALFINSTETSMYKFTIEGVKSRILGATGFGGNETENWMLATLSILALLCLRGSTLVCLISQRNRYPVFQAFLIGGALSGGLTFILDGVGATYYFLGAAFIFAAASVSVGLSSPQLSTHSFSRSARVTVGGVLLVLLVCISIANARSLEILRNLSLLLLVVIVLLVFFYPRLRNKRAFVAQFLIVASVVIGMVGSIVNVRWMYRFDPPRQAAIENLASRSERDAYEWIRENVSEGAILATNRYLCRKTVTCNEYVADNSRNSSHLVSALTRRRLLIEGPRFLVNVKYWNSNYPDWAKYRVELSLGLIESAEKKSVEELKSVGVTHYVLHIPSLDATFGQATTVKVSQIKKLGRVLLENESIVILQF
jgi:hypothetical protein